MGRRPKLDQRGVIEAFEQAIADVDPAWIANVRGRAHPELAGAIARLAALGATDADLALVARHAAWSAAWSLLHRLETERVARDAFDGIHEELPVDGDVTPPARPTARAPLLRVRRIDGAAFSPDGAWFATSDGRIHDVATGTSSKYRVPPHTGVVAWSPRGDVVVFGGPSGVQAVEPGVDAPLWRIRAKLQDCHLTFSSDGGHVVRQTFGAVERIGARTGEVVGRLDRDGRVLSDVHRAGDGSWRIAASVHPARFVGIAPADLTSVRWVEVPAEVAAVRVDGIAVGSGGERLRDVIVFDTADGRELARWPSEGLVYGAAWSPDGRLLLLANSGHTFDPPVFDGGRRSRTEPSFTVFDGTTFAALGRLDRSCANSVAFSADGRRVALSGDAVEVWSVEDLVASLVPAR